MNTQTHPRPSARARELVRGAYDLHVHTSPDIMPRSASDLELAQPCRQWGLAGFVIKSHYVPTAARAALVRSLVPDVDVLGALVLNSAIGGINTMAVEIAAREGARIVWLPTIDAVNEMTDQSSLPPGANRPQWARLQQELRAQGGKITPVPVVDEQHQVLPEVRSVLRSSATHDLVLATGHLDRDEIFAVVEAALAEGVRQIIVTHPDSPAENLSAEDQAALAGRGAFLERCFTTPYTGKISWEQMCATIRASGPEHSFSIPIGSRLSGRRRIVQKGKRGEPRRSPPFIRTALLSSRRKARSSRPWRRRGHLVASTISPKGNICDTSYQGDSKNR